MTGGFWPIPTLVGWALLRHRAGKFSELFVGVARRDESQVISFYSEINITFKLFSHSFHHDMEFVRSSNFPSTAKIADTTFFPRSLFPSTFRIQHMKSSNSSYGTRMKTGGRSRYLFSSQRTRSAPSTESITFSPSLGGSNLLSIVPLKLSN